MMIQSRQKTALRLYEWKGLWQYPKYAQVEIDADRIIGLRPWPYPDPNLPELTELLIEARSDSPGYIIHIAVACPIEALRSALGWTKVVDLLAQPDTLKET